MIYEELKAAFMQGDDNEARNIFNQVLKASVRLGLLEAMEEEVNSLCGAKYQPNPETPYQRAGSEKGIVYANGVKEPIIRPRVKHEEQGEVKLDVYQAASKQRNLFEEVVSSVSLGMSTRSVSRLTKGAVSKSAASRMWVDKSREQLDIYRQRDLSKHDLVCIMIDGVWIKKDLCIVLALGIDTEGNKHALDFEEGSSESKAIVQALIDRLAKRCVKEPKERRLLVLRDGSAAIAGAVASHWPDALQQECLVHVQRNVRDKLRARDRAELDSYFEKLRNAQGKEAGQEALNELIDYVSERNAAAGICLKEKEAALLAFHSLNVPSTLNTTFLSTNIIENMIRNWRDATGNVKLWKEKEDMVSRWTASGMLWSEAGFNKVRHAKDIGALVTALSSPEGADSLRSPSPSGEDKEASRALTESQ